jgi:ubiquinone/menaquinone biosynthesis C-methylase UbiE
MKQTEGQIVRHLDVGETCCDPEWEAAYKRFETADEEVEKFVRRLQAFGVHQLPNETRIIDLFCGRGGGLVALERLGLKNIEGLDLSETLLQQYEGPAKLHLADCRELPFDDDSFEAAIIQGGLHHLPTLPADLDSCLSEVSRILTPDGAFYVVEPWSTPFLRFVHAVVEQPLVQRLYPKGGALAEMIEHERETYENWLGQPGELLKVFDRHFTTVERKMTWGKLTYVGRPI